MSPKRSPNWSIRGYIKPNTTNSENKLVKCANKLVFVDKISLTNILAT